MYRKRESDYKASIRRLEGELEVSLEALAAGRRLLFRAPV